MNIDKASFNGARLAYVDFTETNMQGLSAMGVNLQNAILTDAVLVDAILIGAALTSIDGQRVNLTNAVMDKCLLDYSDFTYGNFSKVSAIGITARSTNFIEAELFKTNFENADLHKAKFVSAYLGEASFEDADLSGSDMSRCRLKDTIATGANIRGATINPKSRALLECSGAIN